jgi:hypothetical protein
MEQMNLGAEQPRKTPTKDAARGRTTESEVQRSSGSSVFLSEEHNASFYIQREKPNGETYEEFTIFNHGSFTTSNPELAEAIRKSPFYGKRIWEGDLPKHIKAAKRRKEARRVEGSDVGYGELEEAEYIQ